MSYYNEIRKNYDIVSENYDQVYYLDMLPENMYVENYLQKIVSENSITSALEFGCGSGYWLEYLAKMGLEHIKGIDFSNGMLEKAKNRCAHYPSVKIVKQMIPHELYIEEKYELLISNYFISSLLEEVDLQKLLSFMYKSLNEVKGKVLIVENKLPEKDIFQEVDSRVLELEEVWGNHTLKTQYKLYSQTKLESLFSTAGFCIEEKHDVNNDIFLYLLKRNEK